MPVNGLQNAFLKLVVPPAQAAQRKWGIPASVTIAQSIQESSNELGWGQSQLARAYNNYFGIKAEHLAKPGTYVELPTKEYVHGKIQVEEADFARYEDVNGSFEAHAKLLAIAQRYRPAMAATNDPEAFARQLQRCGYSTNPTYASGLSHLMSLYDLKQYDVPPEPAAAQEFKL
jgi:flagellum-specific peptidoglycan hydrolase FlgJ